MGSGVAVWRRLFFLAWEGLRVVGDALRRHIAASPQLVGRAI